MTKTDGTIQLVDSGAPRSEADIERLEHDLQLKLPKEYRAFLLTHNGGTPSPREEADEYQIVASSCGGVPKGVYGREGAKPCLQELFGDNEAPPPVGDITALLSADEGPADSLTIGLTVGGKHVRMYVRGKSAGKLVLFDFVALTQRGGKPMAHVTPLADSFGELIEKAAPELTASAPPATDKDIARAEEAIYLKTDMKVRLPDAYRDFVRKTNGGLVIRGNVLRWTVGDRAFVDALERFYWLQKVRRIGPRDLREQAKLYAGRIPEDTLPIGDDDGNLYLLGAKGKNVGKVFFWSHHQEAGTPKGKKGAPTYDNVTPVASSFDEFFDGLRVESVE